MYFCIAKNNKEWQEGAKLAVSIFNGLSGSNVSERRKSALWLNDPTFQLKNLILVKNNDHKIIGMVRLVPRILYKGIKSYKVVGFSSICLDPVYRGKGISIDLINYAIKKANDYKFDFAMLFARRALDHFYNKFGFWGVSSYNKLRIKRPTKVENNEQIFLSPISTVNDKKFNSAYKLSYKNVFGRMDRNPKYWLNLINQCKNLNLKFDRIIQKNTTIGYCIYDGYSIYEISILDSNKYPSIVKFLFNNSEFETLELFISADHALVSNLCGFDIELSYRECSWGGHMIRPLRKYHSTTTTPSYQETLEYFKISIFTQFNRNNLNYRPFNICLFDEL